MIILKALEILFFICFSINILYLFVFSLASLRKKKTTKTEGNIEFRRIAILIPAYKEDKVIMECVESCLLQDYPKGQYDIVVISDQMSDETNEELSALPIILEIVHFENSTKAKALNLAMSHLSGYDIALILDADNIICPDYLRQINENTFNEYVVAYQTHRIAKNKNTSLAYLDAVSEEINNSIFRQGHTNLGLSAALIGSGMAFDYEVLKKELAEINAVGGFDRALELTLFKIGKRIGYLPDAYVLDEKIQNQKDFARQRRRWLSAQTHYLVQFLGDLPHAIMNRNWDFCDKMFQQMSIPRLLLLGGTFIIALLISFFSLGLAVKWWSLLFILLLALAIAIPRKLYTSQLLVAVIKLPETFFNMFLNLFKLKGANKKFIHTAHGSNN
ncbi:glycosyltransferase family 2 protein [Parabacteroides sp. AM08-6]|uniref:glycosyltransferase n=1 Tax=Parabacteroides sp. AM08-6 TaxID=2292053 RepID=UPI000EFDBA6B|nr:glycosyltransferase family 2 protein [Parabacteroides sp. AM08-6]RHJ87755.1 glycosyltransferase family 2 protein [Parabacteroides sp. AM08-6]